MTKEIGEMDEYKKLSKVRFSQLSFFVFQKNYEELSKLFVFFCSSPEGFKLTDVSERHRLDFFQNELIRAVHNFVASAKSLVDHTRVFYNRNYKEDGSFPDYQSEVAKAFVDDELVSFVQDFRNYCLHYELPDLVTGIEMIKGKGTWQFIRLGPDGLTSGSFNWSKGARNFIEQFSEPFDLSLVFETYFQKVIKFYQWFYTRLGEIHKDDGDKVSEAQELARREMAPQLAFVLRLEMQDGSLPVSIEGLIGGFLPSEKLAEFEPVKGKEEWLNRALDYLVDSGLIDSELKDEVLEKRASEKKSG